MNHKAVVFFDKPKMIALPPQSTYLDVAEMDREAALDLFALKDPADSEVHVVRRRLPLWRLAKMVDGKMKEFFYLINDDLVNEAWQHHLDDQHMMYERLSDMFKRIHHQSFWGRLKFLFTNRLE